MKDMKKAAGFHYGNRRLGPSSATRTRGLMLPKHPPYQLGYTRITFVL